jgi:hypothetical protein
VADLNTDVICAGSCSEPCGSAAKRSRCEESVRNRPERDEGSKDAALTPSPVRITSIASGLTHHVPCEQRRHCLPEAYQPRAHREHSLDDPSWPSRHVVATSPFRNPITSSRGTLPTVVSTQGLSSASDGHTTGLTKAPFVTTTPLDTVIIELSHVTETCPPPGGHTAHARWSRGTSPKWPGRHSQNWNPYWSGSTVAVNREVTPYSIADAQVLFMARTTTSPWPTLRLRRD